MSTEREQMLQVSNKTAKKIEKCRRCGKVEVKEPYKYCYKCSQILINGWEDGK